MNLLFACSLGIALAMVFASTSVNADCITTVVYPAQDQVVRGEVPIMISIGSTGQAPSVESVDLIDMQVEYLSEGRWVSQDDLSAQSLLEPVEGSGRKAVIYTIANSAFKGRYGYWRLRSRCAQTGPGDNFPWSSWKQFQVNMPPAHKKK